MKGISRIAPFLLTVWLIAWIALSWDAIQDDALIHLRYADYLHRFHFITFDGIHPTYGTSSLLFVSMLAVLRSVTTSPLLSRYVSTFFHLVLYTTFAIFYIRTLRGRTRSSMRVQMLSFCILFVLALPSAVRWLDDGMETGMVLCAITSSIWFTHRLSLERRTTPGVYLLAAAMGFTLVMLRNELAIVALLSSVILCLSSAGARNRGWLDRLVRSIPRRSHFFVGAIIANLSIRYVMHSFLPDTALAKSHGLPNFFGSLIACAEVLFGALLFGVGTMVLWIISVYAILRQLRQRNLSPLPTLAANSLFFVVSFASALRGQEIQGVRYLVWTFLFPMVWNMLELRRLDGVNGSSATHPGPSKALTAFLVLSILALPIESRLMYRVLSTRAHTMKLFMTQDLQAALPGKLGLAVDVGYISYFTHDPICDAAGLVNGRQAASLPLNTRITRCGAQHPDFLLVNADQAGTIGRHFNFSDFRVCGQYDFANMLQPDRHYLLVKPELATSVCAATHYKSAPASAAFVDSRY